MPVSAPDTSPLVIEAATAELALAEVADKLGPAARILSAEKVLRGGIGGFFAKELVQVRAVPAEPDVVVPAHRGRGVDDLLGSLAASAAQEERSFQEVLRAELGAVVGLPASPPSASAEINRTPSEPLDHPTAPLSPPLPTPSQAPSGPLPGGPDWSVDNLKRLGLPGLLVTAVAGLEPADDLAWVAAVAGAVGSLCRPLPAGDVVLAGPRATRLAQPLGLRRVTAAEPVPELGSVALALKDSRRGRATLAAARGHRWLHLVVGGDGWRELLFDEPLAVSWVGADALAPAVALAADLGLVLGYAVGDGRGAPVRRAQPVDVALALRDLLPRM